MIFGTPALKESVFDICTPSPPVDLAKTSAT
jgi:hypothetical protein